MAIPAEPAPLITTLQFAGSLETTLVALIRAARTTMAVPC